jgi:small subunit ribosomal protein S17
MQEEQNQQTTEGTENDPLNLLGEQPEPATPQTSGSEEPKRGRRKTRTGVVVSNKMQKSIVVAVVRRVRHPLYKKYFNKTKKYMAHDETNDCKVGDTVRIVETRPLSAHKRWRLESIVERAK